MQSEKKQGWKQLSLDERIRIEIRYRDGCSLREIAAELGNGRTAGTVSREIAGRPRKGSGRYEARRSHETALEKRIGKRSERLKNERVRTYTVENLKNGWSPEQVSLRLPIDYPGETISYEAIYQYVYAQVHRDGYGSMKPGREDLRPFLPRRHKRRAKKGLRKAQKLERMEALPSIENRPKTIEERKEVGHWEDDCIVSRESKFRLKTINERATGILFVAKMEDGSIEQSNEAVQNRFVKIPETLRRTLTRDRGSENLGWRELEESLGLSCYFAHPYCSHERGSNENLNGLVRRYFPKKTDFAKVSDEDIRKVEYLINARPRKRFGGKTPYEVFFEKTGVALDC
jgi:IS30 family transposase